MNGFTEFLLQSAWLIVKILAAFCVVWIFISYGFSPRRTFGNIVKTWYRPFTEQQYSSVEFYTFLEEALKEKKMPNIFVNRVTYRDESYLSTRVYLQILRGNQMILVCAAGFGTDYFVSWRQGQPIDFLQDMIMRIPKIGTWIAAIIYSKTFFQQDTDTMFGEVVHQCVLKAIDRLTGTQTERVSLEPLTDKDDNSLALS